MFNNHLTRTLSVPTSARVFMRRRAIPPLCGGAVQALPNIQTTLRDHPHPASRPMTFGHFTSWRADDRGYYTGVEYTPTEVGHFFGARMCPACYCFARDSGPWQARESHRRNSKCAHKSPAKPRWTGMSKKH